MNKYRDNLTFALIGVLYIYAVIKTTLVPMHVPVTDWQMLLFAFASFIFYVLVNTYAGRIVFLSSVALIFAYSIFLLITEGVAGLNWFFDLSTRLVNVIIQVGTGYYNETISTTWLMSVLGVFSLIVAMPVYYFLVKYFRFYYLIVPGLVFFIVVWGIIRYVDRLSFFIFITIAIVLFIRHRYLEQGKNMPGHTGNSASGGFIASFVPVALIIILVASFIPVRNMPIEWEWMDKKIINLWRDVYSFVYTERYDEFGISKTGFGNSKRLGGPVNTDETLIMTVKAPARVYLRGAVYDIYTGFGWESSENGRNEYLNDRTTDLKELQYGWKICVISDVVRISTINNRVISLSVSGNRSKIAELYRDVFGSNAMPDLLRRLYPVKKLEVQYRQIRTKTLFTPLKLMLPITGLEPDYEIKESIGGIFYSDNRLRDGDRYSLDYLQPAYGTEELEHLLQMSRNRAYREFNENAVCYDELIKNVDMNTYNEIEQNMKECMDTFKMLEKRRDEIHEMYLQVPDSITGSVRALAWNLTKDYNTDYDRVKAIERYLRQNFNYTLTPAVPPGDRDFVEYFLFEGKEGYCSYYASAMCILTRLIGIPARYVEGFVLPQETGADGYYYVRNKNAHAWVEVYLEGFGWVVFEPTAPMAGAMNYIVSYSDNGQEINRNIDDMPDIYEPEEELAQNQGETGLGTDDDEKTDITGVNMVFVLLAAVLALWFLNNLFIGTRRVIGSMLPKRRCAVFLYNHAVFLLKQSGFNFKAGETPLNFAARVDELYRFRGTTMKDMVEIYYGVRFGKKVPDKDIINKLFVFLEELKLETGRSMNLFKRIAYRNFLFSG